MGIMKIVLAGNYGQYLSYLRDTGETPRTAKYVNAPEHLIGLQDVEVVRYGTWWVNPCAKADLISVVEKKS